MDELEALHRDAGASLSDRFKLQTANRPTNSPIGMKTAFNRCRQPPFSIECRRSASSGFSSEAGKFAAVAVLRFAELDARKRSFNGLVDRRQSLG